MASITDYIYIERKDVKWLTDQIKNELLHVDNTFQRQYIWTVKNQIRLIETILLGYAIPEIYLWERDTESESGNTNFSVIDGQQRLGSIFNFINGDFKLNGTYLDFRDAGYTGKTFTELTESERNQIWKYPISVRFIKDNVSREDIVNMFLRLNSTTTTLNPQELRNAEYSGLFLRLANELTENPIWLESSLFTGLDYRRMKDIEFISSLLIFIRLGIEEETTQKSINKVYDTFNEEYPDYEEDKNLFENLLSIVKKFLDASDSNKKLISRKVHFYTLFTVAYYLFQKYGDAQQKHIDNFNAFVEDYGDTENRVGLIEEYFQLGQEGTQRKSNRMRRFEILKEILEK
ncbi:hypothetical protein GCM10011344_36270 [Dokdonia pacifica]|uniref:GmrSD restriction endonucleases N-terminal domain-containing protein n=1 Tax=Dokdonia pacifica TaxID=1627892 RepID=A0A239AWE0_9FLAO|nr:DUF262 domain-containing protein [Dokdonia pacifica]GGG32108.1 hypothetical protein GCM10011344_36270 [Dokdonia pacifica]SNR99829.1 Protein of unknown function DUF262 [Dokdonia pacifica]